MLSEVTLPALPGCQRISQQVSTTIDQRNDRGRPSHRPAAASRRCERASWSLELPVAWSPGRGSSDWSTRGLSCRPALPGWEPLCESTLVAEPHGCWLSVVQWNAARRGVRHGRWPPRTSSSSSSTTTVLVRVRIRRFGRGDEEGDQRRHEQRCREQDRHIQQRDRVISAEMRRLRHPRSVTPGSALLDWAEGFAQTCAVITR